MISSTKSAGRRRARFAALLERPDDAGLRGVAVAAARSEAAAHDLGLEADRAWPRLVQLYRSTSDPRSLNAGVRGSAALHARFGLLFALGIALGPLIHWQPPSL